ncbi:WcaG Nucleoside-diphosphate-sugar epimerases [Candidatus Methylopumilus universalis]|uniref:NAD-dependent epimerase/dehydratase family protein n=1 Tax=Candidatus Methylopumilus universalis TaxID=2588536 RepID=UPI003BEEE32A
MKILITGGSGFIGSHLLKFFLDEGHEVISFDNLSRGKSSYLENVKEKCHIINGDIRNKKELSMAFSSVDAVFHLAYINGTENFYSMPDKIIDVGIRGLLNVVDLCIEHSVNHLFIASSSEVYQSPKIIPTPEEVELVVPDVNNPRYTYGGGKILYEIYGLHYASKFIKNVSIFRPHNVYGPDMGMEHVIPQIIKKIHDAKKIKKDFIVMQGDGSQTRSFNYISDFIQGIDLIFKSNSGGIFNIGTLDEIKIKDLYKKIALIMKYDGSFSSGLEPLGATHRRCPDINKIKKLGYSPSFSIEQGLEITIDSYLNLLKD